MIKSNKFLSLKDYEFSMEVDAKSRAYAFQDYIHQMEQFETRPYWVMASSGVGAKMRLAGRDESISAYISNDYLGMSQRQETIEAGIDALRKYGTDLVRHRPSEVIWISTEDWKWKLPNSSVRKMRFCSRLDLERTQDCFAPYWERMILLMWIHISIPVPQADCAAPT